MILSGQHVNWQQQKQDDQKEQAYIDQVDPYSCMGIL